MRLLRFLGNLLLYLFHYFIFIPTSPSAFSGFTSTWPFCTFICASFKSHKVCIASLHVSALATVIQPTTARIFPRLGLLWSRNIHAGGKHVQALKIKLTQVRISCKLSHFESRIFLRNGERSFPLYDTKHHLIMSSSFEAMERVD